MCLLWIILVHTCTVLFYVSGKSTSSEIGGGSTNEIYRKFALLLSFHYLSHQVLYSIIFLANKWKMSPISIIKVVSVDVTEKLFNFDSAMVQAVQAFISRYGKFQVSSRQ